MQSQEKSARLEELKAKKSRTPAEDKEMRELENSGESARNEGAEALSNSPLPPTRLWLLQLV
jgi:hypothetical protein